VHARSDSPADARRSTTPRPVSKKYREKITDSDMRKAHVREIVQIGKHHFQPIQ